MWVHEAVQDKDVPGWMCRAWVVWGGIACSVGFIQRPCRRQIGLEHNKERIKVRRVQNKDIPQTGRTPRLSLNATAVCEISIA